MAEQHGDEVVFIMVNTRSLDDAKSYKAMNNLISTKLMHGAAKRATLQKYGLDTIPHRCVISRTGLIVKNYEKVNLKSDIVVLLDPQSLSRIRCAQQCHCCCS